MPTLGHNGLKPSVRGDTLEVRVMTGLKPILGPQSDRGFEVLEGGIPLALQGIRCRQSIADLLALGFELQSLAETFYGAIEVAGVKLCDP